MAAIVEMRNQTLSSAYQDALALVSRHKVAVIALADALIEHGALDGTQAESIMRQASSSLPRSRHHLAHDLSAPLARSNQGAVE